MKGREFLNCQLSFFYVEHKLVQDANILSFNWNNSQAWLLLKTKVISPK